MSSKWLNAVCGSVVLSVLLTGCRTTEEVMRDYDNNIAMGNYSFAAQEVSKLAEESGDSKQLWTLLTASALRMSGDCENSIRWFDRAEDCFLNNDRRGVAASLANGSWAMLSNDCFLPYDGGGQDRVFTCLYKAIDFMSIRDYENARVELNRSLQYQRNWLYDRRREIDASAAKLEEEAANYQQSKNVQIESNRNQQFNSVMADSSFTSKIQAQCGYDVNYDINRIAASEYMNPYALHVAGVFRWLNGDTNREELNDAALMTTHNVFVQADRQERAAGVRPRNVVWVYFEDGLCPRRIEKRIDLPLFVFQELRRYIQYFGIALPRLVERSAGASDYNVITSDISVRPQPLANIDQLIRSEFNIYMSGAVKREIVRALVKAGVQIGLGIAAKNTKNPDHRLSLQLAQLGVASWSAATTQADCRSWTTLPKSVLLARVIRPANGVVTIVAGGLQIPLQLPEGNAMIFVTKPAMLARPNVRVVQF